MGRVWKCGGRALRKIKSERAGERPNTELTGAQHAWPHCRGWDASLKSVMSFFRPSGPLKGLEEGRGTLQATPQRERHCRCPGVVDTLGSLQGTVLKAFLSSLWSS